MIRRPILSLPALILWIAAAGFSQPVEEKPGAPAPKISPPPAASTNARTAAADAAPAPETLPSRPPADAASDEYVIGAGDVLQISVWKEPDASVASTVVRPEGNITMPLLKEIAVAGMTPRQAERMIAERLGKFINAPDVTVVVSGINSKKIYVIGAAKKEGPIGYTYRMTVMQALSEAGGLTEYAKRKKIYILRRENGRDFRIPFDYDAVLRGEHMELNIPLLAGDTIVIPH